MPDWGVHGASAVPRVRTKVALDFQWLNERQRLDAEQKRVEDGINSSKAFNFVSMKFFVATN